MKKFFLFVAACVALVACQKNEADVNVPARQITIHATANVNNDGAANGPHRIAPNDITASSVSFHWQEGDKIWVISSDFSEKQIFTIDNSTINGNQADFTGTALSNMSSYYVMYLDNIDSEETLMASIFAEDPVTYNYNPDSKNWFFAGEGQEDNFTIGCDLTIRMQLKGSCKLGKVTFLCMDNDEPEGYHPATITINFVHGSYDGLQLSSTPIEVVMPLTHITVYGFTLRFYDTDGNLIMEKSKEGDALYKDLENYGLVNLGVLEVKATPVLPAGALPGEFSVSTNKLVHFSKGNLQATYNGTAYTWGFAENQYDYIGNVAGNTTINSQTSGNVVDLFGFSTATTYYGINTAIDGNAYSGDFIDWGKNIGDGNTWRTLSKDELVYLFNTRNVNGGTGADKSYSLNITFGGKKGLVLYPDDYTGSALSGAVETLPEGVVFLPAAGRRVGTDCQLNSCGYYWSSTEDSNNTAYFTIYTTPDEFFNPIFSSYRSIGFCVRLVTDIN